MDVFQELVFTISFYLIVTVLIAKLYEVVSICNDGKSRVSSRVEEKIEKKWVVCDREKEGKVRVFEDKVIGSDEVDFGCLSGTGDESGSVGVIGDEKSDSGVGACCVFDEMPKRNEDNDAGADLVESDVGECKGSLVEEVGACYVFDEMRKRNEADDAGTGLVESDVVECSRSLVQEVGACYVFDEMPKRTEANDNDAGLMESDVGDVVECRGSLVQEVGACYVFDEMSERNGDKDVGAGLVESDVVECNRSLVQEVGACYMFDEMPKRTEANDNGVGLVESDVGDVVECSGSSVQKDCVGEVKLEEEDDVLDGDWQGIETTELEKSFGAAVSFVDSKVNSGCVNLIDNDVKIELYGLHRVAIEGSCFEPQPMAFKVSARANWSSWKRSENLGRENAMERYIALLSRHVPGWMGSHSPDKQ
ncbi:hypothetical protein QVD17_18723 [Tagetes erecta]|uniref:ACB domain-containing protein n=1 Tax=Tagetes erecta TaxID=13708 RepID=A0AAD8NPB7_TARER|nr:hypothetical protein QVD17_18723 [Tagetes erecta]